MMPMILILGSLNFMLENSRLWAFQGKEEECGLIFTLILMNLKLWNNILNYNGFSLSKTCDTKFI
jgi:hypothetical protein